MIAKRPDVFRRVAWRLLPLLTVCTLFAFVDRVNVGFAALTMRGDLGLSATAYGLGAGIFFIGYFIFELPSNLILVRVGPRVWLARIMVTWGLISAASAVAWDAWSFLGLRFLLGAAEAGFFPGILFFLTQWFPDRWRARMVSTLLLAIPLSNVIGAPISGQLLGLNGLGGLHGWQWLFILEGIPSCILGVVLLTTLPERVEDATFLSAAEKAEVQSLLAADAAARRTVVERDLRSMFALPRVWALAFVFFCVSMTTGTVNFWLPQIIKSAGFSNQAVGLLAAIPYTVGVLALVVWGWHSDRTKERRWHVALPLLLAALGIAVAAALDQIGLRIFGLTLAGMGMFSVLAILWTLPGEFLLGAAAAGGIAVINSIGNLGGFAGPYAVGLLKDLTDGYGAGLALDVAMLLLAVGVVLTLTRKLEKTSVLRGIVPAKDTVS